MVPNLNMRWIVLLAFAWAIVALVIAMTLAGHPGTIAPPGYVGG